MKKLNVKALLNWYHSNKRPLPWRETNDPYKIWISETMLQQTTSTAVIPYYTRFVKNFPTVKKLANAPLEKIYENWNGLGYYSRARNLHKAAIALAEKTQFPKTWAELIELPGFGPYTSRSVSSIAFDESVGVLDGNVIRFVSRYYNLPAEWWRTKERAQLQHIVDKIASQGKSSQINQALMELGATICTPKSPNCFICPLVKTCEGRKANTINQLPLKKTKREFEIWHWQVVVAAKGKDLAMTKDHKCPFLKNKILFPGTIKKLNSPPKTFDLRHNITHHDIYISTKTFNKNKIPSILKNYQGCEWIKRSEIRGQNPSSVIQKILESSLDGPS